MWDLFEKPWSSNFAKHFACFSLFMVLISTVTFVASTAEEFQASLKFTNLSSLILHIRKMRLAILNILLV